MRLIDNARWSAAILFASVLAMPVRSDAQTADSSQANATAQSVIAPTVIAPSVIVTAPVTAPAAGADAPRAVGTTRPPLAAQPRGVAMSRHTVVDSMTPPVPAPANNNSGNTALMLVGAGTMIVGAVVGGDAGTIILLGGAALGIFGLYRYLTN